MRWDDLFADLEMEAEAVLQRERDGEIAERTRVERSRIALLDRLHAARGHELGVSVDVLGAVRGTLLRASTDWLLLRSGRHEWIIDTASVLGVSGLPPSARAPGSGGAVAAALGWASAWRVLARDRTQLLVCRRDGTTMSAVADRVGEDFVELRAGSDDQPTEGARNRVAVPFTAVVAVRCPRQG
ncbi:MAG: hypothetical protein M3419_01335 [Actinomycetota bacterium]|nr:hypothetical protein [Actinomycetota bacterium]